MSRQDDRHSLDDVETLKLKDNTNRAFSEGLANFVKENAKEKAIGAPHLRAPKLAKLIEEYLDDLGSVKTSYTRDQLINDLILMVKQGKPQASTILIDLLGFDSAQETFEFNIVDFKNLRMAEGPNFANVDLSSGQYEG